MKCPECKREFPPNFRTKGGCIWCDGEYHETKTD